MIGHWIEMPTDKSLGPGGCLTSFFFFFFINCTLLSRFTANFCQLQCSLSAKMGVWSSVLRGMMQPHCNTKQIMLVATEGFLVPFFKRNSFHIVKFHFFLTPWIPAAFLSSHVEDDEVFLCNWNSTISLGLIYDMATGKQVFSFLLLEMVEVYGVSTVYCTLFLIVCRENNNLYILMRSVKHP